MCERGKRRRSLWSIAALVGVSAAGSALSFTVTSVQAQNAIEIVTGSLLAGIIVHCLHRSNDVVDAALTLAGEIASVRRDLTDDGARPAPESRDVMATVIALPSQRPTAEERAEVS